MKWILQHSHFALGNFVNITPIIKHLFYKTREPVPVYFETKYVREAYEGHHMIKVLDRKPDTEPFASSAMICKKNNTRDYIHAFKKTTGEPFTIGSKPFARHGIPVHDGNYAVIICGSGNESEQYLDSKIPDQDIMMYMVKLLRAHGYDVIFTGSKKDYNRCMTLAVNCTSHQVGNIRQSIDLIAGASLVIGNDTGLIHIAGTMDKKMLVLWKNTLRPRCENSGQNTTYSDHSGVWKADFNEWFIK